MAVAVAAIGARVRVEVGDARTVVAVGVDVAIGVTVATGGVGEWVGVGELTGLDVSVGCGEARGWVG